MSVEREIFSAHVLLRDDDALASDRALGERTCERRLFRIVRRDRIAPNIFVIVARACAVAHTLEDAFDALTHLRPDIRVKRAYRAEHLCDARDDVVRRAGMDRADRHDRRLERSDFAADDLLHRRNKLCRNEDRIDGQVRVRAVAAVTMDRDLDRIARRIERSLAKPELPALEAGVQVQSVSTFDVEPFEQAVVHHRFGAGEALFGGLKTEDDGSGNLVFARHYRTRGTKQDRDVPVVTAGMHPPGVRRAIRDVVLLGKRQRVHVGAQHHGLPGFGPAQHADDARFADPLMHLVTELA